MQSKVEGEESVFLGLFGIRANNHGHPLIGPTPAILLSSLRYNILLPLLHLDRKPNNSPPVPAYLASCQCDFYRINMFSLPPSLIWVNLFLPLAFVENIISRRAPMLMSIRYRLDIILFLLLLGPYKSSNIHLVKLQDLQIVECPPRTSTSVEPLDLQIINHPSHRLARPNISSNISSRPHGQFTNHRTSTEMGIMDVCVAFFSTRYGQKTCDFYQSSEC